MPMNKKEHYEILHEQILSETKAIRELVQDVPLMKQDITNIKEIIQDIPSIKEDTSALRAVAHDHETRITTLESDRQPA